MFRRERAAALVLHSLCLFNRYSQRQLPRFTKIKRIALPFLDHLLAQGQIRGLPDNIEVGLVFLQYGRYVHEAWLREKTRKTETGKNKKPDTVNLLKNAKEKIKEHFKSKKIQNFTYSFQRVSNRRVWQSPNISYVDSLQGILDEWKPDFYPSRKSPSQPNPIQKAVMKSVGALCIHKLKPAEYLLRSLTLGSGKSTDTYNNINDWLNCEEKKQ